jgi:hypothetical protein
MKDEINAGLPRIQSALRRRPVWDIVTLGGIEKLTERLMSGADFSADDLSDMRALRQRLRAFDMALEARERAAGVSEVVE